MLYMLMDRDYEHHQLFKCCLVSFRNTDGVLLNTNINVKCLQNHLCLTPNCSLKICLVVYVQCTERKSGYFI